MYNRSLSRQSEVISDVRSHVNWSLYNCSLSRQSEVISDVRSHVNWSLYNRSLSRQSEVISDVRSHVNIRYMLTPEKAMKMKRMKKRDQNVEVEVTKLRKKIQQLSSEYSDSLDSDFQQDLLSIMSENTEEVKAAFPEGSFRRLFWEQHYMLLKPVMPEKYAGIV